MYGFQNYFNGYGEDPESDYRPARPPRQAQASFVPLTGQEAGLAPRGAEPPQVMRVPGVTGSSPQPRQYANPVEAWRSHFKSSLTRPASSAPSSAPRPSGGIRTRGGGEGSQIGGGEEQQGFQSAQFAVPEQGENMLGNYMNQHFGQQQKAIEGVNDAMSDAAKQWGAAAQFDANRQHQQAMNDNDNQTSLEIARLGVERERERSGLLRGLLSGVTGMSGFQVDGKGKHTRY